MLQELLIQNIGLKDLNPLICGSHACPPSHAYGPAARDYYLVHYVSDGKGVFHSPRGVFPVGKGQMFVIYPGETTYYQADPHDPWRYGWLGFEATPELGAAFERADVLNASDCGHLFEACLRAERMTVGRELYICGRIYELLSILWAHREGRAAASASDYAKLALNYIESKYQDEIRIDDLAATIGISRSYFARVFKAHTGKSPQQYLVDFRLEKAAALLRGRRVSLAEAALSCGYPDVYSFSRMFRRRYGIPPGRYGAASQGP